MVSELLDYYPYGEELAASASYSSAPETAYTFGGKEHTEDTGLSYFEARHYKPSIGKFISMDPFPRRAPDFMLPDPQSWNSYAYARNNPLAYTDPSGEFAFLPFLGMLAIAVVSDFISNVSTAYAPAVGQSTSAGNSNAGSPMLGLAIGMMDSNPTAEVKAGVKAAAGVVKSADEIIGNLGARVGAMANTFSDRLNGLVKGAYLTDNGAKVKNWDKFGGYDQAWKDFEALAGGIDNVKYASDGTPYIPTPDGNVSIYKSPDNGATVQYNDTSKGVDIKVRYDAN